MASAAGLLVMEASATLPARVSVFSRAERWLVPLVSLFLHIGLVGAVALYVPKAPASEMERGGKALALELAMEASEEQFATQSGARPEEQTLVDLKEDASVALSERAPQPPFVEEPASFAVPEAVVPPELAVPPPVSAPKRAKATKEPAKAQVTTKRQHPKRDIVHPVLTRKIERRKAPEPVQAARVPEARGKDGEGRTAQSRQASTRSGTGGQTAHAGAGAMASYRARVIAHLTRYKNYPEQAQDRGITGRNSVTITLTREGRVASSSVGSSGHALLDAATQAALRRAQPFPPMPPGGPATITITLGLNYRLN